MWTPADYPADPSDAHTRPSTLRTKVLYIIGTEFSERLSYYLFQMTVAFFLEVSTSQHDSLVSLSSMLLSIDSLWIFH